MNVVLAKTDTAHAKSDILAVARDRLPGAGKVADLRRQGRAADVKRRKKRGNSRD